MQRPPSIKEICKRFFRSLRFHARFPFVFLAALREKIFGAVSEIFSKEEKKINIFLTSEKEFAMMR